MGEIAMSRKKGGRDERLCLSSYYSPWLGGDEPSRRKKLQKKLEEDVLLLRSASLPREQRLGGDEEEEESCVVHCVHHRVDIRAKKHHGDAADINPLACFLLQRIHTFLSNMQKETATRRKK